VAAHIYLMTAAAADVRIQAAEEVKLSNSLGKVHNVPPISL